MTAPIDNSELWQNKAWLIDKHINHLEHPLKESALHLILFSDYAARHIDLLLEILQEGSSLKLLSRADYFVEFNRLNLDLALGQYQRELRRLRHTHFLRLMLLQLAGIANTEDVMLSWSDFADAIILAALNYIKKSLSSNYGLPCDSSGNEASIFAVAMGKLGGRELNFSSDIDLIFAYSQAGMTNGSEQVSNEHYFVKVVQQFIQLIHHVTVDGFVFRVDLRLRPNGDSGPLVSSFDAMETYYQEQGRDWERYAMVKARVISDDLTDQPSWFSRLIIPFVYRRYVDFSVIESLRSMKAMIEREVQLNPMLNDIKRGQGGIREVEFIIQNVQLIRGGRLPQLQKQNAMAALQGLKEERLIPRGDALKKAYLFLRQLENALQGQNDQQTHSVPELPLKQQQICLAMGFDTWDDLISKLQQYQRIISSLFHSVLAKVDAYEDEKRVLSNQLSSMWQGHIENNMAINLLTSLGYDNAEHCYQMVHAFRHSPRCRRLSQGARMRLDRFMVLLFTELQGCANTDVILSQVMHLLENIVGRSAYLALLTENPQALKELLFWFANSPFISSLLVSQPFLLEVLLEQETAWQPIARKHLEQLLAEQLSHTDDFEVQEEILRQFKLKYWLIAARAELYGFCSAVRIGKFLSDVAHVIVAQVVHIACQQLGLRQPEIQNIKKHFALIAYGKLGSKEMNYSSDLDLVFLHQVGSIEEGLVTRLTQKILHMLTTRSQTGVLYRVDTRLRPSGSAGLLVSHVDAFVDYQQTQAWTWEHQALLKARIIFGNPTIKKSFQNLKADVFSSKRDPQKLKDEVQSMRAKIDQHQGVDPLKNAPGGLLDLEFLIQYLVLRVGQSELTRSTHSLNQLQQLLAAGALNQQQFLLLKKAYRRYHQSLHLKVLKSSVVDLQDLQKNVWSICQDIYGSR